MLALAFGPTSAFATFHLNRISEVYPGTTLCSDCAFVELQSPAAGQSFVSGHQVTFYDKDGAPTHTATMTANVANGQTQRTILVADQFPPDAVIADFTDTAIGTNIVPTGGAACFETLDCVAWGDITPAGLALLPSPAGTPVAPTGIPDGSSLVRSISPGCSTLFEAADDSNDSATDFLVNSDPNPRPNSVTPTETSCQPPVPNTVIDKAPEKKIQGKNTRFRFSSPDAGVVFECKLDDNPYKSCSSPTRVRVKPGKHQFSVRAVLNGQPDTSPATYKFKRLKK